MRVKVVILYTNAEVLVMIQNRDKREKPVAYNSMNNQVYNSFGHLFLFRVVLSLVLLR